ncbi:hypothetical protein F5Y15DRAFT_345897 [Xylariaceae sp. FL0016]|nr:hypothetical protein F5Y15DRAFT_345897 [Xylariaceae sp. FL0016]
MQLRNIVLAVTAPIAFAAHRTVAHPTSAIEIGTPSSQALIIEAVNYTETIAQASTPVTTMTVEKPPLDASVMGLIVFATAGLYLL